MNKIILGVLIFFSMVGVGAMALYAWSEYSNRDKIVIQKYEIELNKGATVLTIKCPENLDFENRVVKKYLIEEGKLYAIDRNDLLNKTWVGGIVCR